MDWSQLCLRHFMLLRVWPVSFFSRVKRNNSVYIFSWSIVNLTNEESSGHGLSASFSGRSLFQKLSVLPEVCWKSGPDLGYWSLHLETLPTAQRLTPLCHSCWVDYTQFIGGFNYEHHFPRFQLHLQNDRLQCISAALSSLSYLHEKKPWCSEMQIICVSNASRLLPSWAVLLQ